MVQRSPSIAQASLEALARVQGDLLGVGLPAPKALLRGFQPDPPGAWCQRCGGPRHVCPARDGPDQVIRLGPHDGALRDWIILIKHQQWEAMGVLLGTLLGQQIRRVDLRAPPQWGAGLPRVVVPVPMPWLRRFQRGIDHAQVLASAASSVLGCPCVQPLRQRLGGSQVEQGGRVARLQRTNRFVPRHQAHACVARWISAWLRSAGCQRGARSLRGAEVIVVDDVRTTGATLQLMAQVLRTLGAARVVGAVLAVKE